MPLTSEPTQTAPDLVEYSFYANSLFTVPAGDGSFNFSFDNNIEMKTDKDTTGIMQIASSITLVSTCHMNMAAKENHGAILWLNLRLKW